MRATAPAVGPGAVGVPGREGLAIGNGGGYIHMSLLMKATTYTVLLTGYIIFFPVLNIDSAS